MLSRPTWWSARFNLGLARLAEATGRRACAWSGLARAYQRAGDYRKALTCLDRALVLRPGAARLHERRGSVLRKLTRLDEAARDFIHAIERSRRQFNAWFHLAMVRLEQGRYTDALHCFDEALDIRPRSVDIRLNRALVLLTLGDWRRGWSEYTACMQRLEKLPRALKRIRAWDGRSALAGKTILLYSQQGFGDTLQFCRYIPLVAQTGAQVVVQVYPALLRLLRSQDFGPRVSFVSATPRRADVRCSLMGLAHVFDTRPDRVPLPQGYLRADPAAVAAWAPRLGNRDGLRVGLVWSGAQAHRNDHNRSMSFQALQACLPGGIDYVCLQKEIRPADAAALAASPVRVATYCESIGDFGDTAALCSHMDLIVSVDTSIAHLAAAMGKPVWLLLPFVPDFRWLLGRGDSPWYAGVTLLRQARPGEWGDVLAGVREGLRALGAAGNERIG
jgi:hypothetical protein